MAVHKKDVFFKYLNNYFIETGTYKGLGVSLALEAGFKFIRSVELSYDLYLECLYKFKNYSNVHLYHGLSSELLWIMIRDINEPITFWLDAHYSDSTTARGPECNPVLKELAIIKSHPINSHIILIDDVRDMGTFYFDYVTKDQIIEQLMGINTNYKITYENGSVDDNKIFYDDILVAKV